MKIDFNDAMRQVMNIADSWGRLADCQPEIVVDESLRKIEVRFILDYDAFAFASFMTRTCFVFVRSVENADVTLFVIKESSI